MAKRVGGCTRHRDGWVRWYRGKTRFVCGPTTPDDQIENRWIDKKREIDAAESGGEMPADVRRRRTYRDVLAEYLAIQKVRVGAARDAIAERTYHNTRVALNHFGSFVVAGQKVADLDIRDVGPQQFTAYAGAFRAWKASGFDSVVSRVSAIFRWAVEMEYVDRFRPGPEFKRPDKKQLRSERIDLAKSFAPAEVARLYLAGNHVQRCWVALGVCAGFTNADVSHVPRAVVDVAAGVIDFRRRKAGKVRRVIPFPDDVAELLRGYVRPAPADGTPADLFFVSEAGNAYARTLSRSGKWMPSDSISRMFAKLAKAAGVESKPGRNFTGLRTTFYNLAPRAGYDVERKIIMGRAQGTVDLDSYLEDVGLDRLRHVVNHVWEQVRSEVDKLNTSRRGELAPSPPHVAA